MEMNARGYCVVHGNRKIDCDIDEKGNQFDHDLFSDDYFTRLYQRRMEYLKGEDLYLRQVYLFQKAVSSDQFRIYGLFLEKGNRKEAEECYFQKLIEENKLISVFPMLMVEDELLGEREAVTKILIPRLDVSNGKRNFISSNVIAQLQFAGNCLLTTNFFVFGEAKKISDQEISDYIWNFTQKEQYFLLVNTLFHYFQECQFNDNYSSEGPFYIPLELMDYYQYWQKNRSSLNENGDGISKQLLRKLK